MSLREAALKALSALEYTAYGERPPAPEVRDAITALRTALAEAEEPVAWYHPSGEGYDSAFRDHSTVVTCDGGDWSEWIPLYTHPHRREPLTEDAISELARQCVKTGRPVEWALRAVERYHGIRGDE